MGPQGQIDVERQQTTDGQTVRQGTRAVAQPFQQARRGHGGVQPPRLPIEILHQGKGGFRGLAQHGEFRPQACGQKRRQGRCEGIKQFAGPAGVGQPDKRGKGRSQPGKDGPTVLGGDGEIADDEFGVAAGLDILEPDIICGQGRHGPQEAQQ